jgi:DNA-binding response OmpR family regulator
MKKILVADVPQMDGRYRAAAAAAGWEVAFVRTVAEACATLAGARYDAVAIGVHFDDSRMFDLVRAIRSDEARAKVPIVCVRGSPGVTAVTSRTLAMTLKALAADDFVDLVHYADEAAGEAALRAALERLLLADR